MSNGNSKKEFMDNLNILKEPKKSKFKKERNRTKQVLKQVSNGVISLEELEELEDMGDFTTRKKKGGKNV